ncbi:MAG: penicillin-binding protein 2 [Candidatus Babeliales bacterium]
MMIRSKPIQLDTMRLSIIFMIFCLIYAIALIHLFFTQIINHHFYTDLAQRQYQTTINSMPTRGIIYDRNEHPLALNKESISACITPRSLKHPAQVAAFLERYFPEAHERLKNNHKKHFIYIKRKLSPEELQLIETSNCPDILLLKEASRYYPFACCATITGITDIDNNGSFGIELTANDLLAGKPTTYLLQQDGRSKRYHTKKETTRQGLPAQSVYLTIDGSLQFLATQELEKTVKKFNAKHAACIIMNPDTGEILTMTNWPHYDPHNTAQLDMSLTSNKCITQSYELGSVMKPAVALAALNERVVEPNELIDCENTTTTMLDGRPINTVYAAGEIPFWEVMVVSNNIGMAKVAQRLGEKLYDYYERMGFGKKSSIPLPGEQAGFINHPANWSKQSLISLSYGYEIRTTLLQLAQFFSIIANGGYAIQPQILRQKNEPAAPLKKKRLFRKNSITTMHEILTRTTPWRAQLQGYTVMGKTGTANMLSDGLYDSSKNLYTFGGIIQKGSYKRVIITFVQEADTPNLYASQVAAPLFRRIAERLVVHEHVI